MTDPQAVQSAMRAVFESVENARERRDDDMHDPDVAVAATVVLLRNGEDDLEVLMIERPNRGSFAGAWVFPGGKIEDGDRAPSTNGEPQEVADARRAAVRETWEETGLVVTGDDLQVFSCWDPPPGIKLRIRTWFFAVHAPEDLELVLEPGEAVSAEWLSPAEALRRHGRAEFVLYPPTWVTLHDLAQYPDADTAIAGHRAAGVQSFATQVHRERSTVFMWQGDAEYDRLATDAAPDARHRLVADALPWVFTRTV